MVLKLQGGGGRREGTEEPSWESEVWALGRDFNSEFDDQEPLPTIGTCKALCTCEGQKEGGIVAAGTEPPMAQRKWEGSLPGRNEVSRVTMVLLSLSESFWTKRPKVPRCGFHLSFKT